MNLVFVASECAPFSKTGGLADVIGALPPALAALGHRVTVYLPRYRQTRLENPRTVLRSITIPFDDQYRFCSVLDGGIHTGVQFYFIDYPPFFDRDGLYGTSLGDYRDNAERFALYCRAVLEASKVLGAPEIFHCHDWQAALVPVLLRTIYAQDPALKDVASILTVHNIGYQGLFPSHVLPLLMLPWDLFTIPKMEFHGKVNFLKGGMVFSDFITTVSRKYSQEIQSSEYGFGLEGVLRSRSQALTGILNGAGYDEWNPESDPFIAARYSSRDLGPKLRCRQELLAEFGIAAENSALPIVGMVTRLVSHKGLDLFSRMAGIFMREPLALVALGTGEKTYEDLFRFLNREYAGRFSARIGWNEPLAHKVIAGADMLLMPSHYEPCGLTQMYGLKYGTVPIVRATGGLDDTVKPWDPASKKGTGFKFTDYSQEALLAAVRQALQAFGERSGWEALMRNGMACDFSWKTSAKEYVRVYERVRKLRTASVEAAN